MRVKAFEVNLHVRPKYCFVKLDLLAKHGSKMFGSPTFPIHLMRELKSCSNNGKGIVKPANWFDKLEMARTRLFTGA